MEFCSYIWSIESLFVAVKFCCQFWDGLNNPVLEEEPWIYRLTFNSLLTQFDEIFAISDQQEPKALSLIKHCCLKLTDNFKLVKINPVECPWITGACGFDENKKLRLVRTIADWI